MGYFRCKRILISVSFSVICLSLLAGCNAPKSHLETFNKQFISQDYENAALFAQGKISSKPIPKAEDMLWSLQLGSVERMRNNYEKSTEYFDNAEDMLKYFDEKSDLTDTIVATASSDNMMPYKGEEYDGVMLNTYKALNFMVLKKDALARVEFNRAIDRQRRSKEKFAKEISKLNVEMENEQQKNNVTKSNLENPKTLAMLEDKYPSLYNFKAYPDFVNPFATYIAGVYFNLIGDHKKAVDLLKESYGMVKDNYYIAEDLNCTENILDGNGGLENTVWLIFENGLGPVKEEFRIDIPLFIATSKVKYVGIALPKIKFRNGNLPSLTVDAEGELYQTQVISNIDRVVQSEFKKDYPAILTRAIISATAKAIAQYAFEGDSSQGAQFASILVAAYSFASTAADVRIWTALPKEFQVARFPKPVSSKFKIISQGMVLKEIQLPQCNNAIVYVKIPTMQSTPIYEIITY